MFRGCWGESKPDNLSLQIAPMSDPSATNRYPPFPPAWVGWSVAIQLLLAVPPVLAFLTPWQFLPSLSWGTAALMPSLFVGAAFAGFILWARQRYSFFRRKGSALRRGGAIFATFVWFMIGYLFVMVSIPWGEAVVVGHPSEMRFTVSKVKWTAGRLLRREMRVEGLPLAANAVHSLPSSFLDGLGHGTEVIISGRGTSHGLFVGSVRVAD